jgi:uncharacterized protein YecT (DUF1311 family)
MNHRPRLLTLVAALLATVAASTSPGQELKPARDPDDCGKGTPGELYQCNLGPLGRSETKCKAVAAQYLSLLTKLEGEIGNVYRIQETGEKAEEAWVKFRDAQCEHFGQKVAGADGEWQKLNCKRAMNEERIAFLEKLIKRGEEAEAGR